MHWPHLILPVNNQVVEFIDKWRHLFYKFVQCRFNTCIQNNTMFKCKKSRKLVQAFWRCGQSNI